MSIKPIDRETIYKICSGQVIQELSSAVKELVENALDARATIIEIKLKNFGIDSIEVSDNGSGIEKINYESIALKHCTSKLGSFSDLASVSSFGFRGEALNALCELSESFSIVTKTADELVGSSLSFSRSGALQQIVPVSRGTGTTVVVSNLFEVLPVRRGEFVRSAKKQYLKLVKLIQSYAVISVGVKFTLVSIEKNSRNSVIETRANSSLADNISFVFGSKFLQTLSLLQLTIDQKDTNVSAVVDKTHEEDELVSEFSSAMNNEFHFDSFSAVGETVHSVLNISESPSENITSNLGIITIDGFVSKPGIGVGRSDNDRQFIFCNGRPVDLPKFSRLINEVWRQYEMKQKPAFILNVSTPPGSFDVNISPDKREVILSNEQLILDKLRESLNLLYEKSRFTFPVNNSQVSNSNKLQFVESELRKNLSYQATAATQPKPPSEIQYHEGDQAENRNNSRAFLDQNDSNDSDFDDVNKSNEAEVLSNLNFESIKEDFKNKSLKSRHSPIEAISADNNKRPFTVGSERSNFELRSKFKHDKKGNNDPPEYDSQLRDLKVKVTDDTRKWNSDEPVLIHEDPKPLKQTTQYDDRSAEDLRNKKVSRSVFDFDAESVFENIKKARVNFEASLLDEDLIDSESISELTVIHPGNTADSVLVAASGIDEEEAVRVLNRESFQEMQVIGQFNLGFVIARHKNDLYILDQHACDEKYKFETLQKSTIIHKQPLISPLDMDLTYAEELVIEQNIPTFENNGFSLDVDLSRSFGKRIRLIAVPFSKEIQFGVEDIRELASMLLDEYDTEGSLGIRSNLSVRHQKYDVSTVQIDKSLNNVDVVDNINMSELTNVSNKPIKTAADTETFLKSNSNIKNIQLPKLISMFASRACRSSVMIGTPLSMEEMSTIVTNLQHLEQPWNCPHGRPTMRHLVDYKQLRRGTCS